MAPGHVSSIQDVDQIETTANFPFVTAAMLPPRNSASLICIGHPGSEDLESSTSGVKTGYDALHISTGKYHDLAPGQDSQDKSKIGAPKHDCWTYWGHSGAPLVDKETGDLVGLHSSWGDETGMRRGVPLHAILKFSTEDGPWFSVLPSPDKGRMSCR